MALAHKTQVFGNVGSDPEMRYMQNGTPVVNFSVASNEKFTDSTGEKREITTWFRCSAFGKPAEILNQYVKKGDKILLEGKVKASAYMGQDGQPKASLELTIRDFNFIGGGNGSGNYQGDNGSSSRYGSDDDAGSQYTPPSPDLDDIPF